jgi:flagellar motor switch protein FliM
MNESRDLLSQEEIDALLRGVDSGVVPTDAGSHVSGDVRLWDPADGNRVLRSALPALDAVHERFARAARGALDEMLPKVRDFALRGSDQRRFGEYAAGLGNPSGIVLLRVKNPVGAMLMVFDSRLVFALVDAFFGGEGLLPKAVAGRDFTRAELRVVERLARQFLEQLKEAWQPVLPMDFELIGFETRPGFVTAFTSHDDALIVRFGVEVGDAEAGVQLVFSQAVMEPLRPRLAAEASDDAAASRVRFATAMRERLRDVQIEVSAVVAETPLSLRRVSSLRAGDVITLASVHDATVLAEQIPIFAGSFGVAEGQHAVKIAALLDDMLPAAAGLH